MSEQEGAAGHAAAVRVSGLRKVFVDEGRGEVAAVAGLDFECRPGEIFGLLGSNGAGKTTTLRMLSTVLKPSAGEAWVSGASVLEEPEKVRRRLGFYSASTALYPRLSARETLEFFARINRVEPARLATRVEALIERFGITPFADARVDKLSSGMKQKVSIARTLVHDPPVVIFDEPTVGLDVLSALALIDAIQELKEQGKTVIFSTHILSEAEKLCDRIAVIHGGEILVCDTLEGLRERTGERYLEDIFVHYVRDAEGASRQALEEREKQDLEALEGKKR
ncbi:MAG: ABC transporter ATP-binding protein [Acidobacteriota bacterium]